MFFECLKFILNLSHVVCSFVMFVKIYRGIQLVAIKIVGITEFCMSLCKLSRYIFFYYSFQKSHNKEKAIQVHAKLCNKCWTDQKKIPIVTFSMIAWSTILIILNSYFLLLRRYHSSSSKSSNVSLGDDSDQRRA